MDARIVDGRKIARVTDDGKLKVLVHGRDGDDLVPVKVSEDGYLELNQGAPGQNPWPVTLSGQIPSLPQGNNTIGYVGINGSDERLRYGQHDKTTTLPTEAPDNREVFQVRSSPGHIASLNYFGTYIPAPSGATSGSHLLIVSLGSTATANQILRIHAPYNVPIHAVNGIPVGSVTVTPNIGDWGRFSDLFRGVMFGEVTAEALYISYTNNTDAPHTAKRYYRTNYIEWPVA